VFTNQDGSIGFKCHHGACELRTGKDLLIYIESKSPGFKLTLNQWKLQRDFKDIVRVSFLNPPVIAPLKISFIKIPSKISFIKPLPPPVSISLDSMLEELSRVDPTSIQAREMTQKLLKSVEDLPQIDKVHWHDSVRDVMSWSKPDLKTILKDLREQWYVQNKTNFDFFDSVFFVKELNQFYDFKDRIFMTPAGFQNAFVHLDPEACKTALDVGGVMKVSRLDYAPNEPQCFEQDGTVFGNTWHEEKLIMGTPSNVVKWLEHWDKMGWSQHREHMLKWMAYTILHPENKINHMLILGGLEGSGKDYLLYPLIRAMGKDCVTISGDELTSGFNGYLLGHKYIHINEADAIDQKESRMISNRLKPLAAAPPETIRVNEKNLKAFKVRNIQNSTMCTNSQQPIRLHSATRRFYAMWSDLDVRDGENDMLPQWRHYWKDRWHWMKHEGGIDACIFYLRNYVDISQFDPASAPPITEFLREILNDSKTPVQQTIEAFIANKIGAFRSDLVTSTDASNTLRAGELTPIAVPFMYAQSRTFTPNMVSRVMKELSGCVRVLAFEGKKVTKLWVLREVEKYKQMNGLQLYIQHDQQRKLAMNAKPLEIVKPEDDNKL